MPKYFVMNQNMIPEWKSNIDSNKFDIIGNIKIKKDFNQILMIAISKDIKIFECNLKKYNFKLKNYDVPILKSNLQKCIRRSKVKKAVRTTRLLLEIDPNSLLRRLAIIYIEDVILDNYFTYIVWFMVAVSKEYILSNYDKLLILNIVENLAKSKIKENLEKDEQIDYTNYFKNMNQNILNNNYNTIWSLILRNKYGGMKGMIFANGNLMTEGELMAQIIKRN